MAEDQFVGGKKIEKSGSRRPAEIGEYISALCVEYKIETIRYVESDQIFKSIAGMPHAKPWNKFNQQIHYQNDDQKTESSCNVVMEETQPEFPGCLLPAIPPDPVVIDKVVGKNGNFETEKGRYYPKKKIIRIYLFQQKITGSVDDETEYTNGQKFCETVDSGNAPFLFHTDQFLSRLLRVISNPRIIPENLTTPETTFAKSEKRERKGEGKGFPIKYRRPKTTPAKGKKKLRKTPEKRAKTVAVIRKTAMKGIINTPRS